ncbi:MAG TPA: oligosaccharide flippase family protein, partial [Gemmataceae bacterium]|nr:oligosaccharide flippase family protein [Gemmataceae bacterium]
MDCRKRKLLINAAANWVGFAAQMLAAFLLSPILVHGLGAPRYGIWSLVESILAYLLLFDLGVAASVVRYVARFEAVEDRDGLNRVFSTSLCIFAVAGLVAGLLTAGMAFTGIQLLHIPAELFDEARGMFLLLGLNLAIGLPLGVFPAVLDGLERYPAKALVRTAALVLRSILFLVIVRARGGLLELAWAITACNILEHVALAAAAWWYLPQVRFSFSLIDRGTFRAIRGYSFDAFVAMVAGRVSFQTDAIVISAFLAPQFIAFFAVAGRLVEYAKNSLRALTAVLTPAVSALEAQGDERSIQSMLVHSTRYVLWLVMPIQVGLLILGKPFLARWIDPEFAERTYPTLAILSGPLALALSQSVSARILYGTGRLRWFSRALIVEAIVNLLLSVALAQPLGIEGVALGTALPNVLVNIAVMLYVCRSLGVGVTQYLRQAFVRP